MNADGKLHVRGHGRAACVCFDITSGTPVLPAERSCPRPSSPAPRLLGAALPLVLIIIALNVVVIVAMLAYATTEYQASRNSVQAETARALAQSGIDLAAGLISANSTNNAFVTYQRVTNVDSAWRLETKVANVVATNQNLPWKTVAANPAVLHSGFAGGTNGFDLNYAVDAAGDAGFIAPRSNINTNWINLSTNMFRMDWIYIYKTNSTGSSNVVGRIAYWVDDESSKLSLNYSGNTAAFGGSGDTSWTDFQIKRTNYPGPTQQKNFANRNWPVYIDLGGVAGISSNEATAILRFRGDPVYSVITNGKTTNFPSVLAVRIATNTVITNIARQAELGFTATIYSMEEERSYATGKKRFDLLYVYPDAPEVLTMSNVKYAITNNYPDFAEKYDWDSYVSAVYSSVQYPGYYAETNPNRQPGKTFGVSRIYTRELPIVNELSILAKIENNSGTNNVSVEYQIELITLFVEGPPSVAGARMDLSWANSYRYPEKFEARITLPDETSFGAEVDNPTIITGPKSYTFAGGAINGWFAGQPLVEGPTNATLSNALTLMSASTNNIVDNPRWVFPTNVAVELYFNGVRYQSFSFAPDVLPVTNFAPASGVTNIVYHLVAQPTGGANTYRGDPRFMVFTNSVVSDFVGNQTNLQTSLGSLNTNSAGGGPNWLIGGYTNAANSPDLMPPDIVFGRDHRGLPAYRNDKKYGFGPSLSGVGWLGEVPVTTKSGNTPLAWSTPRFWGAGRPAIDGEPYPPDWLIMDGFHMAIWNAEPQFVGSTNLVFKSYGKINVNSAKSFFQQAYGSANKTDTIMDSITAGTYTKDFQVTFDNTGWGGVNWWGGFRQIAGSSRPVFLNKITEMSTNRSSTNNPYTTVFEFLGELSATNLTGNPSWWFAPNPSTNNAATNTTDRLAEGIVRSLVQKLTTRGNQFTIFSVGQSLQPAASGAADAVDVPGGGKAKVVGETYLQAVYERAPLYNEDTGAITNGGITGAPPMRQLFLRELR